MSMSQIATAARSSSTDTQRSRVTKFKKPIEAFSLTTFWASVVHPTTGRAFYATRVSLADYWRVHLIVVWRPISRGLLYATSDGKNMKGQSGVLLCPAIGARLQHLAALSLSVSIGR